MCTITLHRGGKGLRLTMNRDEAHGRAIELAPFESSADGVPWLGPRDGARAGTWIGVNAHGIVACLLNGNVPLEQAMVDLQRTGPSRGEIVPCVLAAPSMAEARRRFHDEIDPAAYPAFMLLLATCEEAVLYKAWAKPDPEAVELKPGWAMVTSSQWNTQEVLLRRRRLFEEWMASGSATVGGVPTFNLYRVPDEEAWSPLLERPHASTRSVTHVAIPHEGDPITMLYGPVRDARIDFEEYALGEAAYSGSQ